MLLQHRYLQEYNFSLSSYSYHISCWSKWHIHGLINIMDLCFVSSYPPMQHSSQLVLFVGYKKGILAHLLLRNRRQDILHCCKSSMKQIRIFNIQYRPLERITWDVLGRCLKDIRDLLLAFIFTSCYSSRSLLSILYKFLVFSVNRHCWQLGNQTLLFSQELSEPLRA